LRWYFQRRSAYVLNREELARESTDGGCRRCQRLSGKQGQLGPVMFVSLIAAIIEGDSDCMDGIITEREWLPRRVLELARVTDYRLIGDWDNDLLSRRRQRTAGSLTFVLSMEKVSIGVLLFNTVRSVESLTWPTAEAVDGGRFARERCKCFGRPDGKTNFD